MEGSPRLLDTGIPKFVWKREPSACSFSSLIFELPETFVPNKASLHCDQSLNSGFKNLVAKLCLRSMEAGFHTLDF